MLKKFVASTSNRISALTKVKFFCCRANLNVTKVNLNKNVYNNDSDKVYKWLMLVIPVTSFGLGCWQTYRLKWKLDLISKIEENLNSPALNLPNDLTEIKNIEYKSVQVRGQFLYEREFLMGPRSLINNMQTKLSNPKNKSGWLVITPFKLCDSSQVILVNRGWISQNMKSKLQELRSKSKTKEVEITGILRLSEEVFKYLPQNQPDKNSWLYRNLKEMSEYFGCLPVWLDIKDKDNSNSTEWPIPNQTKLTIRNEHFSYMVTWYALSIITTFMWYRKFVKII